MSEKSSQAPPQTFHSFASFPHEIQDLIFYHAVAAYPARTLEFTANKPSTTCTADNNLVRTTYGFTPIAPIPPLLHLCSRSREIAKRRWKLSFATKESTVRGEGIPSGWDLTRGEDWPREDEHGHVRRLARQVNNHRIFPHDVLDKLDASFEAIPRVWIDFETDALLILEENSNLRMQVVEFGDFYFDIDEAERARVKNLVLSLDNIKENAFLNLDGELDSGDLGERTKNALRKVFPAATNIMFMLGEEVHNPVYLSYLHAVDVNNVEEEDGDLILEIQDAYSEEEGGVVISIVAVTALIDSFGKLMY